MTPYKNIFVIGFVCEIGVKLSRFHVFCFLIMRFNLYMYAALEVRMKNNLL